MAVCQINNIDASPVAVRLFHKRILEVPYLYLHNRRTTEKIIFRAGLGLGKQLGHSVFAVYRTLRKTLL